MKTLLIIYIAIAFLYFCTVYRNTYKDIKRYRRIGYNLKISSSKILSTYIIKGVLFPFDFLLTLLRG